MFFDCHCYRKPGSRLNNIIDVTGASQYHGFLPALVRSCISSLTRQSPGTKLTHERNIIDADIPSTSKLENNSEEKTDSDEDLSDKNIEAVDVELSLESTNVDQNSYFPLPLATALFSFLYHLASYDSGGEALVSCGMMESLLQVINWHGEELEHITVSFLVSS